MWQLGARTPRHRRHPGREWGVRQAPAQHRTQLPASISALPLAVARDMGRVRRRGRDPLDAAPAPGDRRRGRDDRRAGNDRGLPRRLGRRGHSGREPAARTPHPDPPAPGASAGVAGSLPLRVSCSGGPAPRAYYDKKIAQGKHRPRPAPPRQTAGRRLVRDAPRRNLLRTAAVGRTHLTCGSARATTRSASASKPSTGWP